MEGKLRSKAITTWILATLMASCLSANADAQFLPAGGDSGTTPPPGVAKVTDPHAPHLARIEDDSIAKLIHLNGAYPNWYATAHVPSIGAMPPHAKLIGAFTIAETKRRHLMAAESPSFLPVTLFFSNGQCYSFRANYEGGILAKERLTQVPCQHHNPYEGERRAHPKPTSDLRLLGTSWGFGTWIDDKSQSTFITAPSPRTIEPLFSLDAVSISMMAMTSPDTPSGNLTLVSRIKGKLVIMTLEVSY